MSAYAIHTPAGARVRSEATAPRRAPVLQRACACGGTPGPTGECAQCRRKRLLREKGALQPKLRVNTPGDRFEREADALADRVVRGDVPPPTPTRVTPLVQRQDPPAASAEPTTNEEEYAEAAETTARALLETETGREIKDQAVSLATSLPGLVIVGSAAATIVARAAIRDEALPVQPPAIPLDGVGLPGVKMELTWEGPVRNPTRAMVGFSGTFGGPQRETRQPSRAERQRAENARRAEELRQFRESMRSPEERAAEEAFLHARIAEQVTTPGSPLYIPNLRRAEDAPALPLGPRRSDDEDRPVQRAAIQAGPATAPPVVHDVLASPGRPLDGATRAFMEPRLGYDLGAVRIHTDARAAASARAVQARAYAVGRDVVFGVGEYQPDTVQGRRLLAHELVHVAQQRATGPALQRTWNPCGTAEECPAREPGEQRRARAQNLDVGTLTVPEEGVIVWPFRIGSSNASTLRSNPTWTSFVRSVDTAESRWDVLGFSDCEGSVELNADLRLERAQAVYDLLPGSARAKIDAVRGADLDDCVAANDSEALRAMNRAAVFQQTVSSVDFPEEEVVSAACPPTTSTAAADLAEYVSLVMCAESLLGVTPRRMLSLLRQLYYGDESWSRSRTRFWDDVITCGLSVSNPRPTLGAPLFDALQASQVVGGVDIGHVFTGLEAMVCPRTSVELETPGPNAVIAMSNEEFATWGGDLGSAAAQRTHDEVDRGQHHGWPTYFGPTGNRASHADLEGNIDSYVLRAGLSGSACGATEGVPLVSLTSPISSILGDYYVNAAGAPDTSRVNHARCFIQAIGGRIARGRITNSTALIDALAPRVESFARTFYLGLVDVPLFAIGAEEGIKLFLHSREVTELFLNWLESEL